MESQGRLMGLDYGAKTVGVAVSDALMMTAQGVETVWRERENKLRKTLSRIQAIADQYEVTGIILGLPLNMDDSESQRSLATREFAEMLEKRLGLPVTLWDERLSTAGANDIMDEMQIPREQRKEHLDELSAMLILEDYMKAHFESAR